MEIPLVEYSVGRPNHSIDCRKFSLQWSQKGYSSRPRPRNIFQQLSTWSGHVSDLQEWMGQERKFKRPTLWQKLTWDKSETAEAFDELIAKKIKEMEDAIKHEFTWGKLHHLGMDGPYGYRAFIKIRRDIKAKRKAQIYNQMRRRKLSYITPRWEWQLEHSY